MDRVPPKLGDVLLVLLAVVVGAAAIAVSMGYGLRDAPDTVSAPPALPSTTPERQVRALFLGGPVVAGASRAPGTPAIAEVAAVQLGWKAEVDGRPRAGYTVDGPTAKRISTVLPTDVDPPAPDVVVVQGGELDVDSDPAIVGAAVTGLVRELRSALGPTTRLVLVGPYSPTPQPEPDLVAVRDAVRGVARAERVHFLDPFELGFVEASDPPGLVNAGSRLPTADGHLKIGRLLADALAKLLVTPTAG